MAIITGNSLDNNLVGTVDADELYGLEGNDTLTSGGDDTLNGGQGNDQLLGEGLNTTYEFDAGFGIDKVITGNTGVHTINLNSAVASDVKYRRQFYDLFIQVGNDWLQVKDYFKGGLSGNTAEVNIVFSDQQTYSIEDIRQFMLQGSADDDFLVVDGAEYEVGSTIVNQTMIGGAGDDYIGFGTAGGTNPNVHVVMDGGAGNDYIDSRSLETDLIWRKNDGHDLVQITSAQTKILLQDSNVSDIYIGNDDGVLYLGIQNNDARLYFMSSTELFEGTNTWQIIDNNNQSLSVQSLFNSTAISNNGFVYLTDNYTSTVGNQTLIQPEGFEEKSLTFNHGFGNDILKAEQADLFFEGNKADYVFERNGVNLEIVRLNSADKLSVVGFFPASSYYNNNNMTFSFADQSSLQGLDIVNEMANNSSNTVRYLTASYDATLPANQINEAPEQILYANMLSGNNGITVNGGTGINEIHVGSGVTVIHDVLNGAQDTIKTLSLVEHYANNGSDIVIANVADLNRLSIEIQNNGQLVIKYDNEVGVDSELHGIALHKLLGIKVYDENQVEWQSQSGLGVFWDKVLDNPNHHVVIPSVPNYNSPVFSSNSEIISVLDDLFFTSISSVNGLGGSDTLRGGSGSDRFVVDTLFSTDSVLIQGTDNNPFAVLGQDSLDLSGLGLNSSILTTNAMSRDGQALVITHNNGGQVRIDDFFAQSSLVETLVDAAIGKSFDGVTEAESMQLLSVLFVNWGARDSIVNYTRVIDEIVFADRRVQYSEIAALFPEVSNSPTEGDDIIYGDQDAADYNDYIDALGGNDIVYGLTLDDTLVGGSGNDQLYGDTGNDILDGGTGIDTLVGGVGDDSYLVDDSADVITEVTGEGHDAVASTATYTLSTNVEDLTLDGTANINGTGNALNNLIIGNNGNNVIDGGAGADAMLGGVGNDTYIVDNVLDGVTENANQGTDTVLSSVSYTLGSNVEHLTLQGTSNINGTGNALNNVLTGNAGNNALNGGSGNDTLIGGAGNDTYTVNGGDTVTELANGGTDTVLSTVTYTLTSNVENLTLQGSSAINGTGNSLANVLIGNTGNNNLNGGSGNDTLNGGSGTDILNGGTGNDTYLFNRGNAIDTVTDSDTTVGNKDTIQFGTDVANDQLWFSQSGNNLEIQIIGTNDKMVVTNWFSDSQYHTEEIKSGNGKLLTDTNVQNLVNAMATMTPPPMGQTTLTSGQQATLAPILVANWS